MGKQWKWLLFISLFMLTFVVAACSSEDTTGNINENEAEEGENTGEEHVDGEKILIFNNKSEPTSLDPPIGNDQYLYVVLNNMGEGLTRVAGMNRWQNRP
jgi:dipeptide transport system substrate-binding protein